MSLGSRVLHVMVAALVFGLPSANAALKITTVSQATRPSSSSYGAEQISGITYAGGDLYYAVDDNDVKLYPITLKINRDTGSLASGTNGMSIGTGVAMSGSHDMEGCAFDPASGKVWISQETSALIREFDPATGTLLRSAPVPAIQKQYYGNYSLEALTISGDGMTMWTANEEALKVDGNLATNMVGSVVRLTRFTRESVYDNWTPNGEWAYVTEPIGSVKDEHTRSGVSGLCALPDGTLLVLERRCYNPEGWFPDFQVRIYQVDFTGADDVSSIASLKTATYKKVSKTQLWEYHHGSDMPNYEGMCLGPRLNDGSCVIVLVSDGGSYAEEGVFTLKLSGLNIRTVNFTKPGVGSSSIVGGPYRYMDGTEISLSVAGAEYASAYTNNAASCTNVAWNLSGTASGLMDWGSGSSASFTVSEDCTFAWGFKSSVAATPIDDAESFESYAVGAMVDSGEVGSWTGTGEIIAADYTPPNPPGFPMPKDAHTKVLEVEDAAVRSFSCTTNGNDRLDMMIAVVRRSADESPVEVKDGEKVVIICDEDGKLKLLCRNANGEDVWATLSETVYKNGDWVRLSVSLDSTTKPGETYAIVRINGEACMTDFGVRSPLDTSNRGAWHRTLGNCEDGKIAVLDLRGSVKVDDVIKTTEEFETELSAETTQIDGVPVEWLKSKGMGLDPQKPIPAPNLRRLGYLLADVYDAGIDPAKDEPFAITGIRVLDDGRLELSFNGVREDLGKDARDALYPVYMAETIGGTESPVAGTTKIDVDGGVKRTAWTSNAPIDETQGFYRVKVESNCQQ